MSYLEKCCQTSSLLAGLCLSWRGKKHRIERDEHVVTSRKLAIVNFEAESQVIDRHQVDVDVH